MQSIKRYFSLEYFAGYSLVGMVILLVAGFNFVKDFPPEAHQLKNIQGEIVVIEPDYAHIKYGNEIVKIEYDCLCSYGWKENKLSSAGKMEVWVTKISGDYKAWKLILDDKLVLNKLDSSSSGYGLLIAGCILIFVFIGIIFANKNKQRKNEKVFSQIFESIGEIENPDISVDERIAIIDKLLLTGNDSLIFAFADLGTLNTLPETLQKKIGDALGCILAKQEETPEDMHDMLNVLQPAVKTAVLAHFAKNKQCATGISLTSS